MKEIILSELVSADEIKGQQGSIGIQGRPGPQGEKGTQGPKGDKGNDGTGIAIKSDKKDCTTVGDAYIDLKGYIMIMQSDGSFINGGKVKGPQGDKGETGPQGKNGVQGLKGDQGVKGNQGSKGDKGNDGTGITVKSNKEDCTTVGDAYIDLNGDIMIRQSDGTFTNGGKVKGPQGEKGEQGDKGVQGTRGTQGVQGLKGDQGARGVQGLKGD